MDYQRSSQQQPQPQPQRQHAVGRNPPPRDCSPTEKVVWTIIACFMAYLMFAWFFLPITPLFFVQSVDIPLFNISSSPSQIDTIWNITVWTTNPSKLSKYYYENIEASVNYKDEFLSSTTMASFLLGESSIEAQAVVINASLVVVQDWVALAIKKDLTREAVGFDLILDASVRLYPGIWPLHKVKVKVFCEDLIVGFLPYKINGTMLGDLRECKVLLVI